MNSNTIIQGLWMGSDLSAMERLCISSFLKKGHRFHLYTYEKVGRVPAGTEIFDANSILPASRIFRYQNGSLAGFANFFRYKLLLEKGGWWVDMDTICLRFFDFSEEYVFGSHSQRDGATVVCSGIIKAPKSSAFCDYAWRVCQTKDPQRLAWGETGPLLTTEAVERLGLQQYVANVSTFCPVHGHVWEQMFDADIVHEFDEGTYAVHLWNELWRRERLDKDAQYPSGCLYERLKATYLDS